MWSTVFTWRGKETSTAASKLSVKYSHWASAICGKLLTLLKFMLHLGKPLQFRLWLNLSWEFANVELRGLFRDLSNSAVENGKRLYTARKN